MNSLPLRWSTAAWLRLPRLLLGFGLLLAGLGLPLRAQVAGPLAIFPAVEVEFGTQASTLYQLEGSSNLVDWAAVDEPRCGTGGTITVLLSTRAQPAFRFFRLGVLDGQTNCAPPPARGLVLIGHSDHVTGAANLLRVGGFEPRTNAAPESTDVVLFVVSALDGPMPETRSQIEAIQGLPHGPAAILIMDGFRQPDPELRELVVLELRDLLKALRQPGVDAYPVIVDDEVNVLDRVRELLARKDGP